ncbi:MAG: formate dehydrogenase accessory sulfurtransferase FdhD [Candidatus Methanoliparum thermophilum]|uniref:Formate dehydrogenase accessory sulfurtransferase FdhD n=1 Tax=Methanoliparum thermophilum TaxID=2491083 RepID=A0A520KRY9_METT2|nr:formate dehydrogenase accessory sulfurtransferase FdhD [Candidatus Methanoliparum sp. LAM-1]RZN64517.1 MAG: formate dehydrogenase accessory sulfurtransferase FdhD [Candidatus Methanoliparum thermophilum]BDC35887.1 hypothetical protein MTLP_05690 [Candidatus Methanoliparum sp. LAM-1]
MQQDDDGSFIDTIKITEWNDGKKIKKTDLVIKEVNVLVKIDGKDYRRFSCSPGYFKYFATGIFITNGFDPRLIQQVDVSRDERSYIVDISTENKIFDWNDSIYEIKPKKITSRLTISKNLVLDLVRKLDENSFLFKKTGGTHVVGICQKKTFMAVEDISRHSAIDKAIGMSFLNGIDPLSSIIVVSCRETESIMNKIIMGGFPIIIGLSAPTDAAINIANDFNVTLIGFASKNRFNVYTNDWRVLFL